MQNNIYNILLEEMSPEKANLFAKRIYETIIDIETREFKKSLSLETKIQHLKSRCPNCNSKYYFCFDEWGNTPYHLHCDTCKINIGATSEHKAEELLLEHHKRDTYLEFYNHAIHFLIEEGVEVINAE